MYCIKNQTGSTPQVELQQDRYFPGRGRAVGFLKEVDRLFVHVASDSQANTIEKAITDIKTHCQSKHPTLYNIQAKLNPFSDAYKIEKLAARISGRIAAFRTVPPEERNVDNPFEFVRIDGSKYTGDSGFVKTGKTVLYYNHADELFYVYEPKGYNAVTVPVEVAKNGNFYYIKITAHSDATRLVKEKGAREIVSALKRLERVAN